jgi:putative transposase
VQALGISAISKSEVSRLCASLDEQVAAFRTRRLDAEYPYLWVDARYEHVREGGRVVSMAFVVADGVPADGVPADGVPADGVRAVLGFQVALSEDLTTWREFLQSLVARGLRGVQLVTSDAHGGLKQALAEVFLGPAWQRCRIHFMRNLLARVPKSAQAMVAATVRTIFQQPDRAAAQAQLRQVVATLGARFPQAVELLETAEAEIFTFYDFPPEHRRPIASTNPLERLNKELKRRSAVVGIFPNREAVIRLLGAVLAEQNDEWLVGRHYFSEFSETSMRQLARGTPAAAEDTQPALPAAS